MSAQGPRRTHAIARVAATIAVGTMAAGAACAGAPSPPSFAYTLPADPRADGYTLDDSGALRASGPNAAWGFREQFEIWRGPGGKRWLRSVMVADDGRYRVEGEWRSDAAGRHHRARGAGTIGGEPLALQIAAEPGAGKITIRRGDRPAETIDATCGPDCMVSMEPSGIPMFMMTRDPRLGVGKVAEFRWIGHRLTGDALVTDAVARITCLGERQVKRPDGSLLTVRHYAFTEFVSTQKAVLDRWPAAWWSMRTAACWWGVSLPKTGRFAFWCR